MKALYDISKGQYYDGMIPSRPQVLSPNQFKGKVLSAGGNDLTTILIYRSRTLRQAKRAHRKSGGAGRLSESEKVAIERRAVLQERLDNFKEEEARRKANIKKRERYGVQQSCLSHPSLIVLKSPKKLYRYQTHFVHALVGLWSYLKQIPTRLLSYKAPRSPGQNWGPRRQNTGYM